MSCICINHCSLNVSKFWLFRLLFYLYSRDEKDGMFFCEIEDPQLSHKNVEDNFLPSFGKFCKEIEKTNEKTSLLWRLMSRFILFNLWFFPFFSLEFMLFYDFLWVFQICIFFMKFSSTFCTYISLFHIKHCHTSREFSFYL